MNEEQSSVELPQELETLIEAIHPKTFEFNSMCNELSNNLNQIHMNKTKRLKGVGLHPVLDMKKITDDPRFLMSLERKKARIIEGLRDPQIMLEAPCQGKLKGSYIKSQSKSCAINQRIEENIKRVKPMVVKNISKNLYFEMKKKKNPHMNFSLRYISEQKKGLEREQKRSHREKGNNIPYFSQFNSMRKQQKSRIAQTGRPNTTHEIRKDTFRQNKVRPMSVMLY